MRLLGLFTLLLLSACTTPREWAQPWFPPAPVTVTDSVQSDLDRQRHSLDEDRKRLAAERRALEEDRKAQDIANAKASGGFVGRTNDICYLDEYLANVSAMMRDKGLSETEALPHVIRGFNAALADNKIDVTNLYRYRIPMIVHISYQYSIAYMHAPQIGMELKKVCMSSAGAYIH